MTERARAWDVLADAIMIMSVDDRHLSSNELADAYMAALAAAGYAVVPVEPSERKVDYATNEDATNPNRASCGWEWNNGEMWLDLELDDGTLTTVVRGKDRRTWRDPIAACAYLAATIAGTSE